MLKGLQGFALDIKNGHSSLLAWRPHPILPFFRGTNQSDIKEQTLQFISGLRVEALVPPKSRKLSETIHTNPSLPLYDDILNPPVACLPPRHPPWSKLPHQHCTVETVRCEQWRLTLPPSKFLIGDPTACPPGTPLNPATLSAGLAH